MLDARSSHFYFCQSLYTLQRGLPAIARLLVAFITLSFRNEATHHKSDNRIGSAGTGN